MMRPVRYGDAHQKRCRGFSSPPVQMTSGAKPRRALIRVVHHKGFGSFRRPFARFLEGRSWTGGPEARTRHNRYLTVSSTYIRSLTPAGKGKPGVAITGPQKPLFLSFS